jgi:hypothetical protein
VSSAITTSAIVSVETSGGSTFTTTIGYTTIFGIGGVVAGGSNSISSTTSTISPKPIISTPSSSPSPVSSQTPKLTSHARITGAVTGPLVMVLLFVVGLLLYRRRTRSNSVAAVTKPEVKTENTTDKPQLHGDSLVRPKYELQGEAQRPKSAMSELPAEEPIGAELEGQRSGGENE